MPVGPLELILLGVILIALFGVSRVPSIGRQLGRGAREAAKNAREVKQAVGLTDEEGKSSAELPPLTPKSALKRLID